jgi:hypothetical protein
VALKFCGTTLILAAVALAADISSLPTTSQTITFYKDVLPILQKNCQTCHRPNQVAPMPLLTYQETRPWAKAMKVAVAQRKMPPWFADPHYGHFTNDRSLQPGDIEIIEKWANTGAREGERTDAPEAVHWPEGWQIKPDLILKGPTVDIPAHPKNNVIEWIAVTIPTGFTKDMWITSVEIKPEHPEVVHHMCLGFNPHTPDVKYFELESLSKARDSDGSANPEKGPTFGNLPLASKSMSEDCYLPGSGAADYQDFHAAKLVPVGSDITMNLHYTPNGKAVTDHVRIGITVAKQPPQRRYVSLTASSAQDPKHFAIPANDANWQSPPAEAIFNQPAELVFLMPHMHFRGKDMTFTLEYPDGRKEVALSVPHYDFNWQLGYHTSIHVPKGTKLHVDAHFDNSVNNKFNPNPNKTVYYGEMTWEEMMFAFYGVVTDKNVDPTKIMVSDAPPARFTWEWFRRHLHLD